MKYYLLYQLFWFICCLSPALAHSGSDGEDDAFKVLLTRAYQPPSPASGFTPGAGSGHLLFSHNGQDNAVCVRSIPDINGDGRDEVIAGFDIFQDNENLYCLDGASSNVATVLWKLETQDGASGGYFWGDQCLVPAGDVDLNGYGNFLAGTAGGGRTAYNMDSLAGDTVWKLDTYTLSNSGWVYSLCECGDVNGDDIPEVAFGTGSDCNRLFLIDGSSAGAHPNVLWEYPAGDAVYSVRCMGDVDRDGLSDVLGAVGDDVDRLVCLSGADGGLIWSYNPGTSVYACGVLPDINGDGNHEALAVLWTGNGSAIRCINGSSGILIWSSSDVLSYGMAVDILGDVTGDGYGEVIVSSWENAVTVLCGLNGGLVWKTPVGTVNGGDVWTARAISDLNGDGREDVVAGSFDYHIYAMDGDSGEVFWKYKTNNRAYSVYPVGDLNNDGRPEVAVGTQDTNNKKVVYVLEGDANIPWPGLTLLGSGALGSTLGIEVTGNAGWTVLTMYSLSTSSLPIPPYGIFELGFPFFIFPHGMVPAMGPYLLEVIIPNDPGLVGLTLHFQALVAFAPKNGSFTDLESVTFQ
jgi:hypothetical protein